MNKRQAWRIALAVEASYILHGASSDGLEGLISEADEVKVQAAQQRLGEELLRRAGLERPMHYEEIVATILNQPEQDHDHG